MTNIQQHFDQDDQRSTKVGGDLQAATVAIL